MFLIRGWWNISSVVPHFLEPLQFEINNITEAAWSLTLAYFSRLEHWFCVHVLCYLILVALCGAVLSVDFIWSAALKRNTREE